jgi:hypothetical protein
MEWGLLKEFSFESCLTFLVVSSHLATIQGPAKSHIMRTKDTCITKEIPRDLEALGQKVKQKPKY